MDEQAVRELRELQRLMENEHGYRLWSYGTILGYVKERIAAIAANPPEQPQGKHICCWERDNPHRCILCCQCGKKFEPAEQQGWSDCLQ